MQVSQFKVMDQCQRAYGAYIYVDTRFPLKKPASRNLTPLKAIEIGYVRNETLLYLWHMRHTGKT